MSQNCKSTYTAATTRDANNNTLYNGGSTQGYGGRGYTPPGVATNGNYKAADTNSAAAAAARQRTADQSYAALRAAAFEQVTAKVLFGSVTSINDLKRQEKGEREARRTH